MSDTENIKKEALKDGWVLHLDLTPPSLNNNTADADRLCDAFKAVTGLKQVDLDWSVVKKLPLLLRENQFSCRSLYYCDENRATIYHIDDGSHVYSLLGVAVDIGTTTIAIRLTDLCSSTVLTESVIDNPQIEIAPDILGRIHYCDTAGGLDKLNNLIITVINDEIDSLCQSTGHVSNDIYFLTFAGNTAMTHLFMGVLPKWIIREPYIPVINNIGLRKASDFHLRVNPSARVFVFPNVGSYFGGDLIAGILYSGLYQKDEISILVDIGTNAEVVLGNKNWLIACAGAAGPALEGGVSSIGMKAGPGVIDHVLIDRHKRTIICHTIGDLPPIGICGSGVIDLAAQLFLSGMIDLRGKFVAGVCKHRLLRKNDIDHLLLVPDKRTGITGDLTFCQTDMDSLVRSKAAMYSILETIVTTVGITFEDISQFYVAGTFGSYIRPESAIAIGMIPDLPGELFKTLKNSSLEGATRLLHIRKAPFDVQKIQKMITYLELNVNQAFMNRFSAAKFIPHTDPEKFPRVPAVSDP